MDEQQARHDSPPPVRSACQSAKRKADTRSAFAGGLTIQIGALLNLCLVEQVVLRAAQDVLS